jgi:hypothetical protein
MDGTAFELAVSMPRDLRYAAAVRRLAVHAAQYAGCATGAADPFGQVVEDAFQACVTGAATLDVPILFRRESGPLEVVVEGHVLTLAI